MRYVEDKYGKESVAGSSRSARCCRAASSMPLGCSGLDYGAGDRHQADPEPVMGLLEGARSVPRRGAELRRAYDTRPRARQILDTAQGARGHLVHAGIHAAAVVIAVRPLTVVPLQLMDDRGPAPPGSAPGRHAVLDEADRGDRAAEDGLPRASQPRRDRGLPGDHRGVRRRTAFDRCAPLDDRATFEMMARGESVGVFQFESDGMRDALGQAHRGSRTSSRSWRSTGR